MRRALVLAGVAGLALPAAATGAVQQVLLPGPTPYPTPSPPLVTVGAPPWANLPFKIHARSEQRVTASVDAAGRLVALRVLQRLLLSGTGDYQFVVSAPVSDVRVGPGSQSQPGLRRGQILWSGFSSTRKLLAADAVLQPRPAAPFLPVRLTAERAGDRYALTVVNATHATQVAFKGEGFARDLARLLDRTRRQSLARHRLSPAYVSLRGLVTADGRVEVSAPFEVEGELRFPSAPSSVRGGTLRGRTVTFAVTLGDGRPLAHRVEVQGGGSPRLRLVARPGRLVRALAPAGARTWAAAVRRRPLGTRTLLRSLLEARMQLVRSDQYQQFLSNPDVAGANRTVYVYETSATRARAARPGSSSGGRGWLVALLAVGGSVLAAGVAVVGWAHS